MGNEGINGNVFIFYKIPDTDKIFPDGIPAALRWFPVYEIQDGKKKGLFEAWYILSPMGRTGPDSIAVNCPSHR
jgi:hypothetical protein